MTDEQIAAVAARVQLDSMYLGQPEWATKHHWQAMKDRELLLSYVKELEARLRQG